MYRVVVHLYFTFALPITVALIGQDTIGSTFDLPGNFTPTDYLLSLHILLWLTLNLAVYFQRRPVPPSAMLVPLILQLLHWLPPAATESITWISPLNYIDQLLRSTIWPPIETLILIASLLLYRQRYKRRKELVWHR